MWLLVFFFFLFLFFFIHGEHYDVHPSLLNLPSICCIFEVLMCCLELDDCPCPFLFLYLLSSYAVCDSLLYWHYWNASWVWTDHTWSTVVADHRKWLLILLHKLATLHTCKQLIYTSSNYTLRNVINTVNPRLDLWSFVFLNVKTCINCLECSVLSFKIWGFSFSKYRKNNFPPELIALNEVRMTWCDEISHPTAFELQMTLVAKRMMRMMMINTIMPIIIIIFMFFHQYFLATRVDVLWNESAWKKKRD